MAQYKTPDVYVQEKSTLPPSVAEVATAIPVFIGYTEKSDSTFISTTDHDIKVKRISTMLEYDTLFGGHYTGDVSVTVDADKNIMVTNPTMPTFMLRKAVEMFFANGGGACYIASCGIFSDVMAADGSVISTASMQPELPPLKAALDTCKEIDEITLLCLIDGYNLSATNYYDLQNTALMQCAATQDRFSIMSVKEDSSATLASAKISDDALTLRNKVSASNAKYGAAYYPNLNTSYAHAYDEKMLSVDITDDAGVMTSVMLESLGLEVIEDPNSLGQTPPAMIPNVNFDAGIYNAIKSKLSKNYLTLPPTAAIAGVFSAVDGSRGVWKAPANVPLNRVVSLSKTITFDDQENLNVDAVSGKSINAIRHFTGKGNLVWGARTLAGNDNEWRYVSVRRFFNMVEESVQKASAFAVFEPNTPFTWLKLKTMIESYLENLRKQGALFGESAAQAYFVNVGLGQTMTEDDINNGIMNIEIGLAAVRPAEFIVLTFSHKSITA